VCQQHPATLQTLFGVLLASLGFLCVSALQALADNIRWLRKPRQVRQTNIHLV
jgi:hypothetical protein